ncbi:SprT family zinc-dependent metalloprotease [Neiella marina]|uniref:SprT family zinc-dependent metalloprotease n=1 Tax=Neiella holothuriorum TaxID=2870530 RepID=A0ABS7EDU7_9GAMM|nr:SprT family zinc-dependent metalloprotease [Neiella holothuriorum]MBW8190509.1 SprT family zinc-dependent metalloprotease [Neiella holothuriorum]
MARSSQAQHFANCRLQAEADWQAPLHSKMAQLLTRASESFEFEFKTPDLVFDQRGTSAGSARLQSQILRLNPVLLVAQPEVFVEQILPHELAHLLVHQLYGKVAPHGPQWQHMMTAVFDVVAERTHQLDVSDLQGQQFLYRCGCQQHALTIRRHNKVLRGASYRCRLCGDALQPLG